MTTSADIPSDIGRSETGQNAGSKMRSAHKPAFQPTKRLANAFDFASLTPEERRIVLDGFSAEQLTEMQYLWQFWARPDQLPPPGDWRTWLLLGGRGSGKTRSSAEWIRSEVEAGKRGRLALIGPTADAIRRDMVEGPSGILATAPPWNRPNYEPSSRRIVWNNGAVAYLFSAEEPERLRGPNLDGYWADEICAWQHGEQTWSNLQLCLRISGPKGHAAAGVVSTTPKPTALLKDILSAPTTAVTRSRTMDNASNLDTATLAFLKARYGGTTIGRQELDAELLTDVEGALWHRSLLDDSRVEQAPHDLRRIVVAIDPAGGTGRGSTETGIIVAGQGTDGHGYVLADMSGKLTPERWASRAVEAYHHYQADKIVCETNFGGLMVTATIRSVDPNVPIGTVTASRGKSVRAEPIVSFYEQGKIHHCGMFPGLEDQLCEWDPNSNAPSPDRLDALVWAMTELMGNMRSTEYYIARFKALS